MKETDAMRASATYKIYSQFYDSYTVNFQADIPLYKTFTKDSKNILEVGCGTGRILKELAEKNKTITGVDISTQHTLSATEKTEDDYVCVAKK